MPYKIVAMEDEHAEAARCIFNEYVPTSFSAYFETPLTENEFARLRKSCLAAFVAVREKNVVGFGLLRPYHPATTFNRTGEVSYFVQSGKTNIGIGTKLLAHIVEVAQTRNIDRLLASVCSLNPESLAFHHKHDFVQCGVFRNIGKKNGRDFSVVWFEKKI